MPTDDVELARKQVEAYPDSPEARFLLAVALTRTSRVEEALKEVKAAKKLAQTKGGPNSFAYFDKMITAYEDMLKNYPDDNRVRYQLAWAYYMKAYLLAKHSQMVAIWKAANPDPSQVKVATDATGGDGKTASATADKGQPSNPAPPANQKPAVAAKPTPAVIPGINFAGKSTSADLGKLMNSLSSAAQGNTTGIAIPSMLDKVDPADLPQIKKCYELAVKKLDDLLARKPDDVWSLVYRAHLKEEYSGNLDDAMKTWTHCKDQYPNNPAAYFFLGEGYLKQGNLKESVNYVSRAVALRAMGF